VQSSNGLSESVAPGTWTFYVASYDANKVYSTPAAVNFTVPVQYVICEFSLGSLQHPLDPGGFQETNWFKGAPGYALVNCSIHPTSYALVPRDQTTGAQTNDNNVFDTFCPILPTANASYTSPVFDSLGVGTSIRSSCAPYVYLAGLEGIPPTGEILVDSFPDWKQSVLSIVGGLIHPTANVIVPASSQNAAGPSPSTPSISLVQSGVSTTQPGSAISTTYTFSGANVLGDLIVVLVDTPVGISVANVTDLAGNIYQLLISVTDSNLGIVSSIYYCLSCVAAGSGNVVSINFGQTQNTCRYAVAEFSPGAGCQWSLVDVPATGSVTTGTAVSVPINTTGAHELLVAIGALTTAFASAGSSYISFGSIWGDAGAIHKILSVIGAHTPSMNQSGAGGPATILAGAFTAVSIIDGFEVFDYFVYEPVASTTLTWVIDTGAAFPSDLDFESGMTFSPDDQTFDATTTIASSPDGLSWTTLATGVQGSITASMLQRYVQFELALDNTDGVGIITSLYGQALVGPPEYWEPINAQQRSSPDGVTFGAWFQASATFYSQRYVQFMLEWSWTETLVPEGLESFWLCLDAPSSVQRASNVSVPIGGITVTLSPAYRIEVTIQATAIGSAPVNVLIISQTLGSFTVELFDPATGASVAGVINWFAEGI
jgi:hypothetical protein